MTVYTVLIYIPYVCVCMGILAINAIYSIYAVHNFSEFMTLWLHKYVNTFDNKAALSLCVQMYMCGRTSMCELFVVICTHVASSMFLRLHYDYALH